MVQDAKKYKAEDESAVARISAKNGLDSYSYNLTDDKLIGKFDQQEQLKTALNEAISCPKRRRRTTK